MLSPSSPRRDGANDPVLSTVAEHTSDKSQVHLGPVVLVFTMSPSSRASLLQFTLTIREGCSQQILSVWLAGWVSKTTSQMVFRSVCYTYRGWVLGKAWVLGAVKNVSMGYQEDYISEPINEGTLSDQRFLATARDWQEAVWEILFGCQNMGISATDFVMAGSSDRGGLWAEWKCPASKIK